MRRAVVAAVLAASVGCLPAAAEDASTSQDAAACNAPYLNPDDAIAACMRLMPGLSAAQQARAYVNIGFANFKLHRFDEAIAAYDTALTFSPNDAKAFNSRGQIHRAKFEFAAAIADFTSAIDRAPKDFDAFGNRCEARAEANTDLAAALDDCDTALRLYPGDGLAFGQRALVLLRMGKFADAIAGYDKGIAAEPDTAAFFFGRGIAKARSGDRAGSDADVTAARRLDGSIGATFANFGLAP